MIRPLLENCNPFHVKATKQLFAFGDECEAGLYIVGGFLRDAVLAGKNFVPALAKDVDIVVSNEKAVEFAQRYATKCGGHFVLLDDVNDCARIVLTEENLTFDFAGRVGPTLEKDLARRDFTINALAWQPNAPNSIVDLFGGVEDLEKRVVRAVSEQTFLDDPLRVLRAIRFASCLDFDIEEQTIQCVRQYAHLLKDVAAERINVELFTALNFDCTKQMKILAESGVLEVIFPELTETHRVTPNDYHHLGLFDHSLETVPQLEARENTVADWVLESLNSELSYGVTRRAATKLAAILHDIGKPQTWQINEDGRHTFIAHDTVGAEMCEVIAERMKWSKPVSKLIVKLVKWHLRPGALFHNGPSTEKAIKRFYRQVGEDLPELIMLAFADFGATRGPGLVGEKRDAQERGFYALLDDYKTFHEAQKSRVRLLDGNDVIRLLQLKPGPIVGKILAAIDEAQDFNEIADRPDAEHFIRNLNLNELSK